MKKHNSFFQHNHTSPYQWEKILVVSGIFIGLLFFGVFFAWMIQKNALGKDRKEQKSIFSINPAVVKTNSSPPPTPHPYPVNKKNLYPGDEVSAESVVVLDVDSHVYLYKRNESLLLFPASTTKIMTALVALDNYELDDVVTIGTQSAVGQVIGLVAGEKMTVENLLYGALIHSGNDAAQILADHYQGGTQAFIDKMNEKAKQLHMDNTHFKNPTGYDDPEHKMTAMDLATLSKAAIQNKIIAKMVAIPSISISDVTHTYFYKLTNVNQLLGKIPGVAGIKTGWTEAAGENLVTFVDRDGHRVIFVVLHSKDRFGDTTKLIDWVYSTYAWEDITPSQ